MYISTNYNIHSYNRKVNRTGINPTNVYQPQFRAKNIPNISQQKKIVFSVLTGLAAVYTGIKNRISGKKSEAVSPVNGNSGDNEKLFKTRKNELKNFFYRNTEIIPKCYVKELLSSINEENILLAEKIFYDNYIANDTYDVYYGLKDTNSKNIDAKLKIYDFVKENSFVPKNAKDIVFSTTNENFSLAEKLCKDTKIPQDEIAYYLGWANAKNIALAEKFAYDPEMTKYDSNTVLRSVYEDELGELLNFAEKLYADKNFPKDKMSDIFKNLNSSNLPLAEKLCADKDFPKDKISGILFYAGSERNRRADNQDNAYEVKEINNRIINLALKMCDDKRFDSENIYYILSAANKYNIDFIEKLCDDSKFSPNMIQYIAGHTNASNKDLAERLYADNLAPKEINSVLASTQHRNAEFAEKMYDDNENPEDICHIVKNTNESNIDLAKTLIADKKAPRDEIPSIINRINYFTNDYDRRIVTDLCLNSKLPLEDVSHILEIINSFVFSARQDKQKEVLNAYLKNETLKNNECLNKNMVMLIGAIREETPEEWLLGILEKNADVNDEKFFSSLVSLLGYNIDFSLVEKIIS